MEPAFFILPEMSVLEASSRMHPFTKTRALLDHHKPGKPPVALTIGEPQNQPPAFLADVIAQHAQEFNRYPPNQGSDDLLEAQIAWLKGRYDLGPVDLQPQRDLLASAGSREGITMAIRAAVARKQAQGIARPLVMMPNPFYHSYVGACLSAGGQAILVNAEADTGFLPDFNAVPDALWQQSAAVIMCSPSNPQGAIASAAVLKALAQCARRFDCWALFDDCYAEIYRQTPPPGVLAQLDGDYSNVLALHSMSKRSSAAGLRCGFITGDRQAIGDVAAIMKFTGAAIAAPLQAGAAALLRDEAHVAANRARYNQAFDAARAIFDCPIPEGGFFLWLPVDNAEEACLQLWQEEGIRTLPGDSVAWGEGGNNPGSQYLRLALVIEPNLLPSLLQRVADCLKDRLR